jgi:hypothetical protein
VQSIGIAAYFPAIKTNNPKVTSRDSISGDSCNDDISRCDMDTCDSSEGSGGLETDRDDVPTDEEDEQ